MDASSSIVVGDAFGASLTKCWGSGAQPGVAFEIVERDDGYIGVTDAARYFDGPEQWSDLERAALGQVRGRVLDVGCGAGRHAVPLHEAGHTVIGLDTSPAAVAITAERGVPAFQGTAQAVPGEVGQVDTVLLLGNNLGLLGSRETSAITLAELARITAPGGQLLGSGMNPYRANDPAHLAYHECNRTRGRMPGQVRMRVRHGVLATPWFDYLFTSIDELTDLVLGTEWSVGWVEEDGTNYTVRLDLRG